MSRKRRSDRNHLVYEIECIPTGATYIGITVMKGIAKKRTLQQRWKAHQYKAFHLGEDWALPKAIRKHGVDNFDVRVLDVIRGKAAAYAYEAQLINDIKPKLNTRKKQSK